MYLYTCSVTDQTRAAVSDVWSLLIANDASASYSRVQYLQQKATLSATSNAAMIIGLSYGDTTATAAQIGIRSLLSFYTKQLIERLKVIQRKVLILNTNCQYMSVKTKLLA